MLAAQVQACSAQGLAHDSFVDVAGCLNGDSP